MDLVNSTLINQNTSIREIDSRGLPGGIIQLNRELKTIIIPDLHGRVGFIKELLDYNINGVTVLKLLEESKIQVVCVGDGIHSERRGKERWILAEEEYFSDFKKHKYIDQEMLENLTLMELIFVLKTEFPDNFFFLKGNHENILNQEGEGNYPFGKFTHEGAMVKLWVEKFYGEELLRKYYRFEKGLPILAIGRNFLISHSEPCRFYSRSDILNYYTTDNVISDFTWTRDGQAESGSVLSMLENLIEKQDFDNSLYFSGHRQIKGLYNLRADNLLVQIHNPNRYIIVIIESNRDIKLETDILDINGDNNG